MLLGFRSKEKAPLQKYTLQRGFHSFYELSLALQLLTQTLGFYYTIVGEPQFCIFTRGLRIFCSLKSILGQAGCQLHPKFQEDQTAKKPPGVWGHISQVPEVHQRSGKYTHWRCLVAS